MADEIPELKPCPFCGGNMSSFAGMCKEAFAKGVGTFLVNCECGCLGPESRTMTGAVKAWNTRTPPKVKPLVWVCEGGWRWKGVPPDGFFKSVAKWVWEKPSGGFKHAGSVEVFDTIDAAKAAAQVDYERRILSALE